MFNKIKNLFNKTPTETAKPVAKTTEIIEGSPKIIMHNNEEIAIFNVKNQFYAISNTCAHRGGPLGEGTVKDNVVTCPWHMWRYDVTTGKGIMSNASVKKYELEIKGEEIFIK